MGTKSRDILYKYEHIKNMKYYTFNYENVSCLNLQWGNDRQKGYSLIFTLTIHEFVKDFVTKYICYLPNDDLIPSYKNIVLKFFIDFLTFFYRFHMMGSLKIPLHNHVTYFFIDEKTILKWLHQENDFFFWKST